MNTQIKICGLCDSETIRAAIEAGASHIGLNFFKPSPRYVEPPVLKKLIDAAKDAITVAICVDPDEQLIAAIMDNGPVDILQLHGSESPERMAEIRASTGIKIWKAIPVEQPDDASVDSETVKAADRILFDAKPPKGSALPGGVGQSFDWTILRDRQLPECWALSGGLDADNVAEALRTANPPLVDVSSGVESAPGVKDVDKIARFCEAVRAYDRDNAPQ